MILGKTDVHLERLHEYDQYLGHFIKKQLHNALNQNVVSNILTPGQYCLAGGTMRCYYENRTPKDIDIYVLDDETWNELERRMARVQTYRGSNSTSKPNNPFDNTADMEVSKSNGIRSGTFKYPYRRVDYISFDELDLPVQFLRVRYFPNYSTHLLGKTLPKRSELTDEQLVTATTVEEIVDGFDFTCCMAGVQFTITEEKADFSSSLKLSGGRFHCHKHFLPSVASKTLRVVTAGNIEKSGVSYHRFYKYVHDYGYRVEQSADFKELEKQKFIGILAGITPDDETYS